MPVASSMSSTMNSRVSLKAVGWNAQVVPVAEAVGHRLDHPVDVEAQQAQQLPAHHGDLGRVDAEGAEDRAAAAFGALVEVVEPLLEDVDASARRPPASLPSSLARRREVARDRPSAAVRRAGPACFSDRRRR